LEGLEEMAEEKTGLLESEPGSFSSMRVGFILALINAIGISWYILLKGNQSGDGMYLVLVFLIAAFGGKGLQSFAENLNK
jgi:hypothetical protein